MEGVILSPIFDFLTGLPVLGIIPQHIYVLRIFHVCKGFILRVRSIGMEYFVSAVPVSYTHLTLPTILRV